MAPAKKSGTQESWKRDGLRVLPLQSATRTFSYPAFLSSRFNPHLEHFKK
jgi:hypothetical protein